METMELFMARADHKNIIKKPSVIAREGKFV